MTTKMGPQAGEQRQKIRNGAHMINFFWNPETRKWRAWSVAQKKWIFGTANDLDNARDEVRQKLT